MRSSPSGRGRTECSKWLAESCSRTSSCVGASLATTARRGRESAAMSVLHDPKLEGLLAALHARSDEQLAALRSYDAERVNEAQPAAADEAARLKAFRSDKLVALDRDKAEFCYQLCRAGNARRIVEIGTSYGVSTLYLAAAVRDNIAEAGLSRFIDLREGDLRQTLKKIDGPVDFVLMDIWIAMARPALELVAPHLRPGAIVVCDNTEQYRSAYADYFAFLAEPANGFRTMTLPFDGGLELSVHCPP